MKRARPPAYDDPELARALVQLRRVIFKYPMAVQAAFSNLVAEGRRFATTEEGAEWYERLKSARALGQAELLWEILSSGVFSEKPAGALPSYFVDALAHAIKKRHLEPLLTRLFERRP
jgi:hypothetical protein